MPGVSLPLADIVSVAVLRVPIPYVPGLSDRVPVSRLAVRPESLGVAVRLTIPEKPLRLRAPIDVLFESPRDTTRL